MDDNMVEVVVEKRVSVTVEVPAELEGKELREFAEKEADKIPSDKWEDDGFGYEVYDEGEKV